MKKQDPTYAEAKRASGLTDAEVAQKLRDLLGDVRGISVHSASLWARGLRNPPWWALPTIATVLGAKTIRVPRKPGRKKRTA